MYYNIVSLIRKKPTTIIVHAGANNCINDNSIQIIKNIKVEGVHFAETTILHSDIFFRLTDLTSLRPTDNINDQ